jgi:hypothetical protein
MRPPLAASPSVSGVIHQLLQEVEMRRFIDSSFGTRVALMTTFISVIAVVLPLVALAGNGDPTGI